MSAANGQPEGLGLESDRTEFILDLPLFFFTGAYMQLIEYNDIADILELDIIDEKYDVFCLSAAWNDLERLIGYCLSERENREIHTVKDNRIILDSICISEIIQIEDLYLKQNITYFTVDYKNKSVYFVPCKVEEHNLLVVYKSGFNKESFPNELKEALIKIFFYKKNNLRKMTNGEEVISDSCFMEQIKTDINFYCRKRL